MTMRTSLLVLAVAVTFLGGMAAQAVLHHFWPTMPVSNSWLVVALGAVAFWAVAVLGRRFAGSTNHQVRHPRAHH